MANILLIEPDYLTKFSPLGLMRISSMHKARGDKVMFFKGIKETGSMIPDKIYITTLFTYEYPITIKTIRYYVKKFPHVDIWVGGILASTRPDLFKDEGVKIHIGLLPEAECFPPDYDLFPDMDYSLSFISRGCHNKCGFCVVPQLEGGIKHRANWTQDINPKFKKIVFFDNNWLAVPEKDWLWDVEQLKKFVDNGVNQIDFNQSIDCRLFTEDKARILAENNIPILPLRFSFDHMGQDKAFQKAVGLAKKYKFRDIRVDVLYNWMDKIEDFYYRLKETSLLTAKTGGGAVLMRYAPLDRVDRENYVGKFWTKTEVDAVHKANPYPYGQISSKSLEEFDYYFGKNPEEFKKLLNFPDIKRLTVLKRDKFNKAKITK